MRRTRTLVAGLATTGLLIATPTVASAGGSHAAPTPQVKSSALAAPFNLSVTGGQVLVADGGLNLVGKLKKDGTIATIAADQPGASGVATSGKRLAFTTTVTNFETFENTASGLNIWGPRGKRVFADTLAFEKKKNPDQINHYGVRNPSQCVIDAFTAAEFPYDYNGAVDSHAYSVTAYRGGWIVADAGANALFRVDNKGKIRTLAVLPPQPTKITADMAAALGLPDCVAGITYAFEPVPTDVEVGKDGYLYVTTLPGGPESPVLGARGKVWKVNPYTGKARVIASGFLGATNLALGSKGEIYVSELFAGQISVIRHGKTSVYAALPGVVAVETGKGALWAATLGSEGSEEPPTPPAPGTIVKFTNGHGKKVGSVR